MEDLKGAYEKAQLASGSAAKEQENYAKSIQYSIDKVKASAQELATTFLNSDVVKSLMESFNTFLQNINRDISMGSPFIKALEFILTTVANILSKISEIPFAIEAIIALLAKSTISSTKNIFDGISSLIGMGNKKGILSSIFGINKSDVGFLETFITKYKELTAVKIADIGVTSAEKIAEDSLNKERIEGSIATSTETAEEVGNTTAKVANTGATISLTAATKALSTAIKSNPIGLIATVAAVAIVGLVKLADKLIVTSEEIQEASATAKNAIDEVYSDISNKISTIKELGNQYAELAQKVKDLGTINQSQGSLSTDEYEEFLDLSNQLVDVFPQLIKGYDDNGNAILDLSGDFDTITGSLQGLLKVEQDLANQKIIENLPDVYAGYADNIKNYEAELESLEAREKALLALRNSDYEDVSKEYGQNTFRFNWGKISEQETIEIESELMRAFEEAGMSIVNSIGAISDLDGNKILDITIDSNEDLEKFQNLSEVIGNTYGNILNQIQIQESKIKGENASFSKYLNTWLEGQWLYSSSDPLMQKVMKEIVLDDDFMNILKESGIDTRNWDSLSRALEEQLIAAIDDVDDAKIKDYMSQLLSGENFDNIDVAYSEIIKYLIGLPGFDENSPIVLYYETQQTEYNNKKEGLVKHLTNGITDIREGQKLAQQIRDNFDTLTNNQVNKLMNLSIPNGVIYSWEELLDLIKEVNSKTSKFDISQFSSDTETFESLQSLYNSFRENIENGTLKNPLDIGDIQGLDDTFKVLDSFEDFQNIALNSASSINEVQDAFDKLATEYANAKYQVDIINDSNKELIASQMELDGITRESADAFTDYYAELNKLSSMGDKNIANRLKDSIKSQMEKLNSDGGVDLTLRPVIDASELKAKGWDAGDGIATLFSSTFSNEDNTIAMNFTPIMTDGNGHRIGILTEEELQRYAEKVIAGGEDYYNLKIGATFEGEDAIEQAVEQAEYIHELQDQFYNDSGELNYSIFGNEEALTEYAGVLGITTEALAQYILEETMADGLTLDTSAQIQSLLGLANQANLTGECYEYLIELEEIYAGLEAGVYGQGTEDRAKALTRASELKKLIENAVNDGKLEFEAPKIDFNPTVKSAGGAGKDAGDAYVDAYEKELEKLEADRDQGLITERQFLDKWKDLIDKFFKGVDGYTDKYKSEMSSWQNSMLSYMNSVGSAVISLIDRRIQETEKARDAAIKALEDEKQAALDAIDAQIDEIDDLIDAKNDEIDQLQDEINAINDAADARQRDLDLMQAQYELERAMNQRTKLLYSDSIGFHYETDTSEVRQKKEDVDAAKREQEIAEIEKKIELKEKEIELLEKQKETLEEQKEAIEKYYDELIKQQEEYWQSIIDALEETKSKWEEIMMLDELAENWGLVEEFFKESGYSVEDVINGNEGALNEFKSYYIDLLSQMHTGNEGYLNGLEKFGGSYQKIKDSATDTSKAISDMNEPLGKAAENVGKLGNSAGTAATGVSDLASGTAELKKGVDGTGDELKKVTDAVNELTDLSTIGNDFTNIAKGLTEIKNAVGEGSEFAQAIDDIKNALVGEDGSGGIVNALTLLSQSKEIDLTNLNGQFKDLAEIAKTLVSTLGADGMSDGTALGTVAMANSSTEGIGGLSTSLKNLNTITLDGLIQQFNSLLDAITNVANAIDGSGMSSESGMDMTNAPSYARAAVAQRQSKEGQSGEGGTLNDALTNMELVGTQATNALIGVEGDVGFQGIINKVNELIPLIGEEDSDEAGCMTGEFLILNNSATEYVQPIVEMFANLVKQISAAVGEIESLVAAFEKLGDVDIPNLGGFTMGGFIHFYNGTVGKAFAKGTKYNGLEQNTDALTSEFGQPELIVKPNGEVELTTEPTLQKLPKDTIIFNGEQTEKILKGKTKGKAFANGTLPNGFSPLESVNPIEFNKFMDTTETLKNIALDTYSNLVMMQKNVSDIARSNSNINHNNMNNTITIGDIHITCPGVTSDEVMQQIGTALNKEFAGMALNAYQRTMKR